MSDQGTVYADFLKAELDSEYKRLDAVYERSLKTLTSAGALVTLALAVFGVLLGKDFTLSGWAKTFVVGAALFLLASAVCAGVVGMPSTLFRTASSTLEAMIRTRWQDTEVTARGATAYANLQEIKILRPGTDRKYRILFVAIALQILSIILLAVATIFVAATGKSAPPPPQPPCTQVCVTTPPTPPPCAQSCISAPSPQIPAPHIDVNPSIAISPSIVVSVPLGGQPKESLDDPPHKGK